MELLASFRLLEEEKLLLRLNLFIARRDTLENLRTSEKLSEMLCQFNEKFISR